MHLGGLGRTGDGLKLQCIRRGLLFNGLESVGDGLEMHFGGRRFLGSGIGHAEDIGPWNMGTGTKILLPCAPLFAYNPKYERPSSKP